MIELSAKVFDIPEIARNDPLILQASQKKIKRVRDWLQENHYDALILSRRENFFWLTTGRDPIVVNSSDYGIACLAITAHKCFLFSHVMDVNRIAEEQIPGQDYEIVQLRWYEGDPISHAIKTLKRRIANDSPTDGVECKEREITNLHYP